MKIMMRAFLTFLLLSLGAQGATLPVLNGNGTLVQMNVQTDPGGAFSQRFVICDGTNPDVCAPVSATTGTTVTPVQSSAAALQMTAVQLTAANLNATVVQATGSNLHMVCDSGCTGSGGTSIADEAAFTAGTTPLTPIGGLYQTTATNNPLVSGQAGVAQLTINRAVHTNLRNATGTEVGTAGTPLQVSLANTATNATPIVDTATLNQGGAALSTTNGIYTNLLQSNAVIAAGNPLYTANQPQTTGGLSAFSAIVPNNTTSVAVGTSAAHQLYGLDGFSIAATTPVYVKFYNATQGGTTCGSGTPVLRYMIPASGGAPGSGEIMHDANGIAFSTALTYCVTAALADNDTTAPNASSYVLDVLYK